MGLWANTAQIFSNAILAYCLLHRISKAQVADSSFWDG